MLEIDAKCVCPDEGGYMYRSRGAYGGHDGYRHVQILLCVDMSSIMKNLNKFQGPLGFFTCWNRPIRWTKWHVVDEELWWWEDALPIQGMHPLTYWFWFGQNKISWKWKINGTSDHHHHIKKIIKLMTCYEKKKRKKIFLRCKVNQLFVQKWLQMKKHGTKKNLSVPSLRTGFEPAREDTIGL